MTSSEAKDELDRIIATTAGGLSAVSPAHATKLMADFYCNQRASDCDISEDGDMLLFEWGVYPWSGESFRIQITRQFIPRGGDDDDIYQLVLGVHYPPDDEARAAAEAARASRTSNRWCASPQELSGFLGFVAASPAMALAAHRTPFKVTLEYNHAA